MTNTEILNRFDVLYNNITSSQAPGLDEYEKSVFFNKAQLEVLKNKLNPKGNKYGEGFDFSSKRQLEFSGLTSTKQTKMSGAWSVSRFTDKAWVYPSDIEWTTPDGAALDAGSWDTGVLAVANERINALSSADYGVLTEFLSTFLPSLFTENVGNIGVLVRLISWVLNLKRLFNLSDDNPAYLLMHGEIQKAIDGLNSHNPYDIRAVFDPSPTTEAAISQLGLTVHTLTVVPINNVEYDTLMSRPYKYPPKAQAWRLIINNTPEFVVAPEIVPVSYKMRYIRTPQEVDLSTEDKTCELPDFFIDEVLQRAVELAKAAYVGDMNQQQIIQSLGERSE